MTQQFVAPQKTILDDMSHLRGTPSRQLGFGAKPQPFEKNGQKYTERQAMIGMVKALCTTPVSATPTIESVNTLFGGPPTTASISQSFGSTINLLTPQALTGSTNQYSTMAQVGEFQTYVLVTAIQWRMDVEPLNYVQKGNSIPFVVGATGAKVVSPDVFVNGVNGVGANSDATLVSGPLGLTAGQSNQIIPALMEWGVWQDMAAYFMARAYKLQWNYGQHTLFMNEDLRYTMFVPSNAQNGSSGSSEIDPVFTTREMNNYYQSVLGSASQFLMIDRSRFGNQNLGSAGQSVFHPTRAFDTTGVTYGGAASRALLAGNTEWKKLCCPILIGPGIPIGLVAQQASQDYVTTMQSWLDPGFGFAAGLPAAFTESAGITAGGSVAGGANVTGVEPSLDAALSIANALQVLSQRVVYKGGRWSLTLGFKGVELTPDQASQFKDPATRQMIAAATGMLISPKQLWNA